MITKKDLKGLSKRELKEMLCLASQWCEECGLVLEFRDCSLEFAGQEIDADAFGEDIESLEDESLPFSFDPYDDCDRSDLIREIEIAEEKHRYLEIDNEDLKTAIRVLVDLTLEKEASGAIRMNDIGFKEQILQTSCEVVKSELMKHEEFYDAFVSSVESALHEVPEVGEKISAIAERITKRIFGEE